MGIEIDLLRNYPRANRDLASRQAEKTEEVRAIAREFGQEFFDGDRKYGYGGFHYNPRFWSPVITDFEEHFGDLTAKTVLDVGCGKGFLLFDLLRLRPGVQVTGIDISKYAIENAKKEVRHLVSVADAKALPFAKASFDLVISINTIHNLALSECKEALREISRVSKGQSFITVDAYRNEEERERMWAWNLTAKTILSTEDWKALFEEVGYRGDYFWFIP
jgi:SAM-dependent methyltransferase